MIEKMTLEQFQQIRNQLTELLNEYENYYDSHKNDEDYDSELVGQKLAESYLEIQDHLLSYDLSDIPFEAWQGFQILSDENHAVDFSKTKANIDFGMVDYYGNGNFKGCNVRNLDKIIRFLNEDDFDEQTIQMNQSLFLTDEFSSEFKDKYYSNTLTIEDIASLSPKQLEEIKQKDFQSHIDYSTYNTLMLDTLGLDKVVQLYNYSQQEYEAIRTIFDKSYIFDRSFDDDNGDISSFEELLERIKKVDITDIKNLCFSYLRNQIIYSTSWFRQDDYPELFISENPELFLVNENIPEDVKERFFRKDLKIEDLINYPDAFQNIYIDNFMEYGIYISEFARDNYGMGKFQELVQRHPDVFLHLEQENDFYIFNRFLTKERDLEKSFVEGVKRYYYYHYMNGNYEDTTPDVPEWLSSMNFKFVERLNNVNDILQYTDSTFVLDRDQRVILDTLNIENIKQFEQETGFFSHKGNEWSNELEMFNAFSYYFRTHSKEYFANLGIDFKDGNLSYEEFLIQFAKCIDNMRSNSVFSDYPDYDWIQGKFRDDHPELFMDPNAPDELKKAFYRNNISPNFLYHHKEYIPYLIDKNLSNTIRAKIELNLPGLVDAQGNMVPNTVSFIDEYVSRYGNEKLLKLISKYGDVLSYITISSFNGEIEDEQAIEQALRKSIYDLIINKRIDYSYLANVPEFIEEYPEIFVNFDNIIHISQEERERITFAFYSKSLTFDDIKKYPELVEILKDKDLFHAFGSKNKSHYQRGIIDKKYSDLELLKVLGNEKFLQLCAKYGRYMDGITRYLNQTFDIRDENLNTEEMSFDEISKKIEEIIIRECKLGNLAYYPDDAPIFLRESHPELFLSDDAPERLKQFFYNYGNNYPMTFEVLQKNKDWLPFLKGKSLTTALLRNHYFKTDLIRYLNIFGEEKGIKLGINKAETVMEMMRNHQVDLMKSWYDKTGGKFIPDFVVMQNFRLEEADKFLASGSNWSKLMKINSYSSTPEGRDAMLKLAYSFGAFDQDQRGFKKLQDLLTAIPRTIGSNYQHIIGNISSLEEQGKMMANTNFGVPQGYKEYLQLKELLPAEGFQINPDQELFSQIYKKNEDGSYTLTINPQSYPRSSQLIRKLLDIYPDSPTVSPRKAHQLFGGFELKYDPDFRDFLLANMDKILENPEYTSYVSSIQRQFSDIKAMNSNRVLTWELAVSFVQANKYSSVNIGNERVAEISAIAGYSQLDFNTLQQIYNYGKQRTFSSIPRIEQVSEKISGRYTYEILRLDDPLAMAIGTLTDCCQELNNCAEVCMEHSMVDKNGRVFVIKDEQGNIVAQSWVWRNKNVLCFDNIEIPDKAFARANKEHPELGRKGFTDEIFEIYKQAAHDLIEADEKVYRELLESGKITQEQYDGLRLGKVTVGLGYNDIAESLKQNSRIDLGTVSRPLPFEEPVKLSRALYTSDSSTQYILEEREDRKDFDGETLPVHNDTYIEYTDDNFTEKTLLTLNKLELVTKENPRNLETSIDDYADSGHFVTELARNYGLNPETTRVVMNANFAIIYDINGDKLRVADLLFNTRVDNELQQLDIENQVTMQMKLAFEQIGSDKEIDISDLNDKQKEMYKKITELSDEIDIERGVGHAR